MKILAIRGGNLASLPRIDIDFEKDPLARAGLFAICGPTGAGKSTLLDALCVALFDKTPRLSQRGGVPVGLAGQREEERLPANDVRGILRRGAGEGFAEVDFLGRDQHRYRARWEVWRARRKPEGRLQPQAMSLEDLDAGKSLTGTKSETLQLIEDRLGLSFEQFRRSALLAQGEFAAFLCADDRARGELLERMTGTEIYSALSRAAFERSRHEERELDGLLAEVDRHAILDDVERQALETRHEARRRQLVEIEADIAAMKTALAWYARLDELVAGEAQAQEALDQAQEAWRLAAPLRRELDEIDRARGYRAVVQAVDRAGASCEAARAALDAAELELSELDAAHQAARLRCEQSQGALDRARHEIEQARPALAEAETLDATIRAAQQTAGQAETDWREAHEAAARARDEHDELGRGIAADERALADIDAWLADHTHIEPLAAQWPRWNKALGDHARVAAERARLDGAHTTFAAEVACARAKLDQARLAYDQARDARDVARARAHTLQLEADEISLDSVRKDRDAMDARTAALGRLATLARDAGQAVRARDRHDAQARAAREQAAESTARAEKLATRIAAMAPVIADAERTFERMRLTVELSAHRGALVAGEPCPLCGAGEHPFAAQPSPAADMLDQQRSHVEELRQARGALDSERAQARERAKSNHQRAAECAGDMAEAAGKLAAARASWQREIAALGELALMDDPAPESAARAVDARLQAASAELERLRALEHAAMSMQDRARRANSVTAARESDLTQAQDARAECEARARDGQARLDTCGRDMARCARDMATIAGELAAALGAVVAAVEARFSAAWDSALAGHAHDIQALCKEWVEAWQRRSEARADLGMRLQGGRGKLDAAAGKHAEATQRERTTRARHDDQAENLAALRRRRARILDGRAAAEVRDQLEQGIAAKERALRQAETARQEGAEALAGALARRDQCRSSLDRLHGERDRARADLDEAVSRSGLDADTLRRHCGVDHDWLRSRRDELAALDRGLSNARAVRDERRAQRHRHERSEQPAFERAQIHSRLARQGEVHQQSETLLSELGYKLRADDQARAERKSMAARLDRQKQRTRLYKTMAELIGSSDGKKFRVFAQSLTLDALLAYANRHLEELAGRYRLVRVPGYDLELQVIDRDMGDEVRSVNSLSGGESFLVSLALALGLSSLAARDTKVESLLIDEGFGSLDPVTLETALSVLDALQASGRKVGLISHIPGLAERVGVRIMVRPQGGGRSVIRVTEEN